MCMRQGFEKQSYAYCCFSSQQILCRLVTSQREENLQESLIQPHQLYPVSADVLPLVFGLSVSPI